MEETMSSHCVLLPWNAHRASCIPVHSFLCVYSHLRINLLKWKALCFTPGVHAHATVLSTLLAVRPRTCDGNVSSFRTYFWARCVEHFHDKCMFIKSHVRTIMIHECSVKWCRKRTTKIKRDKSEGLLPVKIVSNVCTIQTEARGGFADCADSYKWFQLCKQAPKPGALGRFWGPECEVTKKGTIHIHAHPVH